MRIQSDTTVLPFILFISSTMSGQIAQDPVVLDTLLDRVAATTKTYGSTFRNLTAEEVREFETYDDKGKIDKRRRVVSDLVVHSAIRSLESDGGLAEYRSVREVDGKPIKDSQNRITKLSRDLSRADSSVRAELEAINKESARYDLKAFGMTGITLSQGFGALFINDKNSRTSFELRIAGMDRIEGRDVIVLTYLQKATIPGLNFNIKFPSSFKIDRFFERGKLWIDPLTAMIWRQEHQVMVQPAATEQSLLLIQLDFEYATSRFDIPIPHRIVGTSYLRASDLKGSPRTSMISRVTAQYGSFQRFGADVQIVPSIP